MANRPHQIKGYVLFDLLTKGIYTTFTRAIKEAVSNAYDAGAHSVAMTFDPPKFMEVHDPAKLTIQIRDDGKGMLLADFWEKFTSIESQKDPTKKDPTTGRYPIGQFGIGSFALVPFSRQLTIYSKKFRSKPIKCVIDSIKLLARTPDDFPEHVRKNIQDSEIDEDEWKTIVGSADSGTVIVINGVTYETYAELVDGTERFKQDEKGLFPKVPFTTGLKEIAWELSTLLPLNYANDPGGIYQANRSSLTSNNSGIHITLSEVELEREIYTSKPGCDVSTIDYKDEENEVHARGVIIALPDGAVQPRDANGVILRLNNVGIGGYQLFGLVGNAAIQHRITGEVHILEGLHKALNAPRDRFSGPAYDKLKEHLHDALAKLSNKASSSHKDKKKREDETQEKKLEQHHKKAFEEEQRKQTPAPSATTPKAESRSHAPVPTKTQEPPSKQNLAPQAPSVQDQPRGKTGEISMNGKDDFQDPVTDVQHTTGKVRFDKSHPLFTKFRGKAERQTIEIVLRALLLAQVSEEVYQRIIARLLSLK